MKYILISLVNGSGAVIAQEYYPIDKNIGKCVKHCLSYHKWCVDMQMGDQIVISEYYSSEAVPMDPKNNEV